MKKNRVLVLALGLLAVMLLAAACGSETPTATIPPARTLEVPMTALPATPSAQLDSSWARIQAAGKIVVGTSADYPPFESYASPGQLDGFDIALMDEIGRRLGVTIEYHDFAFDGLGPALLQGQLDAAIAAISRTPEREAVVDFSNVYLMSEDGILAREDSNIALSPTGDLTAYKVGVERNTVYQRWFQSVFIDTGKMSPDNLFAYEKATDAVRDLKEGRVDLVALDAQAARAFVEEGGVKLVAKGRGQQQYAIALAKGAAALKAKLDEAITGMYNDGTIGGLATRYLGVVHVLPTPTFAPTSTPAPQPSCSDGLALVKHLTQEGEMKPGQTFTKAWQVKNTGTCTWDTNYRLTFASGQRMGGEPVALARQVAPGDTYDLQVPLVAPLEAGMHQGTWQMKSAAGRAFGESLKVEVKVVSGPTATPAPTQTPVAGISFTVDRTNIRQGECVTFSWNAQNVREVYFYAEGERWQDHGAAGEASQRECPPVDITYYLRVVKRDNTVETRQIPIYVAASPQAPNITRFTVDPASQITLGQCVTVRWEVQGNVTGVKLAVNGGMLWDGAPTSGNYQHCPTAAGPHAYVLEATGSGGVSRAQQNMNVVQPATATPVPTPIPGQPVIYAFSVSPNQIAEGDCVDINWSAGGGASYLRVLRSGAALVDDGPLTGHGSDCPAPAGIYTYRLEAYNAAGQSVYQQRTVAVWAVVPPNPLADTFWRATQLNGQPVLAGTGLTTAFGADGSLNGSAGCNSYSAYYSVDGESLSIGQPSATGMFCADPPGIMEQEAGFLAALTTTTHFRREGSQLYLFTSSGVIEFVAQEP
jgi:polar amino acid transport system substrate-binding protein